LLANDEAALTGTGIIRTVYDPACGTGGMLAITEERMKALNPKIRVELYGQELKVSLLASANRTCSSPAMIPSRSPSATR